MIQQHVANKPDVEDEDVFAFIAEILPDIMSDLGQHPQIITRETPLYGGDDAMDSLSLVLLVSAIEEAVRDRFGTDVLLASERAMSMRNSPYRTVGTLVRFIEAELALQ